MASSLTYQLHQQKQQQQQPQVHSKPDGIPTEASLPSPPNSSYGDEQAVLTSTDKQVSTSVQQLTDKGSNGTTLPSSPPTPQLIPQQQQRRDSLQSHFSTLTLQALSNSLPANYTIDHSSIKASLHQALATTVAAAAVAAAAVADTQNSSNANHTTAIPIETSTCGRRSHSHAQREGNGSSVHGSTTQHSHHHYLSPTNNSVVATAAATGGLGVRHFRRPSASQDHRKHRYLSPSSPSSPSHNIHNDTKSNRSALLSSTSLPVTTASAPQYRCDDCGKVYKHPSCLAKHRWEHSEEWELTSKLLLTKHQQVQMLEAAAILVSMDSSSISTSNMAPSSDRDMDNDEDDEVDILNDDDDDDDDSIQVDIDDDDMMMEMDHDDGSVVKEEHAFPSMVGSTPAMLPSSFTTLPLV